MGKLRRITLLMAATALTSTSAAVEKVVARGAGDSIRGAARKLGDTYCNPNYCRRQLEMKRLLGDDYYKKNSGGNTKKNNRCICPEPDTQPEYNPRQSPVPAPAPGPEPEPVTMSCKLRLIEN